MGTMRGLEGRRCVVTGAANGIGRGIAGRLAAEGASVCIGDVDGDGASAAAEAIVAAGGTALGVGCDVTERASVEAMLDAATEAFGGLDVMYNNAGICEVRMLPEIREQHWRRMMDVNALGVLICTQEATKRMIAAGKGGKIVNTASIAGRQAYPPTAHYCASKFAVVALTQASARHYAQHGITVNAICPGLVDTPMWDALDRQFKERGGTERDGQAFAEHEALVLLGRASTPQDVAGLAAFLASDDAGYMTGQSIHVDGGLVIL